MGDNKDSTGLIILGIVLGAILAFALLGRRTQALQPTQSMQQQPIQWQPTDIPRVEDIKHIQPPVQTIQPDPQLVQMTSQLGKATSQLEQAASKLQDTISRIQQNTYLQSQPSQPQYIVLQTQTIPQTPVTVQPIQPTQTSQALEQHQQTQQPQSQIEQDNLQQIPNTIYKNDEKWEIKRGPDGRIKSLNIIRDVKKNG